MQALVIATVSLLVLVAGLAQAQVPPPPEGVDALSEAYHAKHYSPYAGRSFPGRVFWGDTHLHTALSFDAGAFGNRLGIEEAVRRDPSLRHGANVWRGAIVHPGVAESLGWPYQDLETLL